MANEYNLGDRVWYEAEDGNRYLMVVKESYDYALSLYPYHDTRLTLKDISESKYNYIGTDKVSLATAATDKNLSRARDVGKTSLAVAVRIAEKKGHPLSPVQMNLIEQSVVLGFMQDKQDRFLLDKYGM